MNKSNTQTEIDISFCLPVYNVKPYLFDCITSITDACDSNLRYEIVCVDDCSSDDSYNYLIELKNVFSELVVLKNDHNMGVSYTRNRLISISKGKYIWFVDPDDMLCKKAAIYFFEMIEKLQCDVLLGNYVRIEECSGLQCRVSLDADCMNIEPYIAEKALPVDQNNQRMRAVWGGLFKRSFIINNNLTMNERMIAQEDTIFYFEFSLRTKNIYKWEIPCYLYRQRSTSVMHTHNNERAKKYYLSMREMLYVYQTHLKNNDYDNREELLNKIHHCYQNIAITLAAVYDKEFIKNQLIEIEREKIYPYKFRFDAFKSSGNIVLKTLIFLIPLKPFFWIYHYLHIYRDKKCD